MAKRSQSRSAQFRRLIENRRGEGDRIGFVPTMGFLHEGHQSLIAASRRDGNFTVVSIFVNPAQFGPGEDLESYPREPERDFRLAEEAGADLVWYPAVDDLFAPGSQTKISPGALGQRLCGLSRPQFFGGICTVVLKFLNILTPDKAYFGEKDFQQLAIIRQMVRDFYLETDIVGCPTKREADGLAMSSRNARLKPKQRPLALTLYQTIQKAQAAFARGDTHAVRLRERFVKVWPDRLELDYLEFREPHGLEEVTALQADSRIFLGAWLDGVRLIDNAPLGEAPALRSP